ncbi:ligand-binding sensor domain-containing diguanylate cyclase [Kangiella geojedonensis]|uniref:diguanylate cyclase n=1 Tax=Kangiella geojedonensis TaxID=914150 RepID=A0A0F6RBN3_9GAMM|nr:diguanylate cyclase [Kangiella geojedonensis]AKE51713.1 diguanylate cyclase [Kangiella geojedonensis]
MKRSEKSNLSLIPHPIIEYIGRSEDLPTNQLHHITIKNKILFISTPNGLIIYYGDTFRLMDRSSGLLTHGLRSTSSASFGGLVSSDKGLDAITPSGEKVFSIDTTEQGYGWCQKALEYKDNEYLLATAKGLVLYKYHHQELIFKNHFLENEVIINLINNDSGDCLIHSVASGLWLLSDGKLRPYLTNVTLDDRNIVRIGKSLFNSWVLLETEILVLDNDFNLLYCVELPEALHYPTTACLYKDDFFLASANKLTRLSLDRDLILSTTDILNNVTINDLKIDDDTNLWIASERKGLIKVSGLADYINIWSHNNSNSVLSLRQHPDNPNICLVGGSEHSYFFDINRKALISTIPELNSNPAWDVQYFQNKIWAATHKGLITISNNDITSLHFKITGPCRCLFFSQKCLLLGAISGLYRVDYASNDIEQYTDSNNLSLGYVYTIYEITADRYLVGTLGRGLWLLTHLSQTQEPYKLERIKLSKDVTNVYGIDINSAGEIAITADNFIFTLDERYHELSVIKSNSSVAAWACLWSDNQKLITAASDGLKIYNVATQEQTFLLDNFPSETFWEFTTSRSILRASQNTLLCGLNDFIAYLDYEAVRSRTKPPTPTVFSLSCSCNHEYSNNKLSLKTGKWDLQIWLSSSWYWAKEPCHYQYRLLGFNEPFKSISSNRIDFNSLPAGKYILEVKVSNNFENRNIVYQLLLINVESHNIITRTFNKLYYFALDFYKNHFRTKEFVNLHGRYVELEAQVEERTSSIQKYAQELERKNKELKELSGLDPLTQIHNRSRFDEVFEKELYRALRNHGVLSLLMLDIDHFKAYNDTYGHLKGDHCIQTVASCISECFNRSTDLVARYGGEEFVVLVMESNPEEILLEAKRVNQAIIDANIPHQSSATSNIVTVSVGATSLQIDSSFASLNVDDIKNAIIESADQALYQSKNNGRNQAAFKPTNLN